MLECQVIDLSGSGNKLRQAAVAFNTEFAGNAMKIVFSAMFTMTFRTMLLMSGDEIRLLMSIVVTEIRITGEEVPSAVVTGEAFLIRSGSRLCVTAKRQDAVQWAGKRQMAHLASTLKHMMRR